MAHGSPGEDHACRTATVVGGAHRASSERFGCSRNRPRWRPNGRGWSSLKADSDLLVVRKDESLDYHKGVLHDVTEDAVRFDLDGEVLPVKRSKVYGFAYRHGARGGTAAGRLPDHRRRRLAVVGRDR